MTAAPASRHAAPTVGSARRLHYGGFYGLTDLEADDRPLLVVHGNCQAEALRVVLDASPQRPYRTVRVPPVHELVPADVWYLQRLLDLADVLVCQPVRDGYHDLPLGTRDLVARAGAVRLVLVPVVRHHGLHPYQGLVRVEGVADPPLVPYHDLRTLARAAGTPLPEATPAAVRAAVRLTTAELVRRQERHGTLRVDDLLAAAGTRAAHTVNHPGNPVLVGLAARVQETLGWAPDARDPGRTLLGSVVAPVEPAVLQAQDLDPQDARRTWRVDGVEVEPEDVVRAQTAWYAQHPQVVSAGLDRHAATLAALAGRTGTGGRWT